MTELDVRLLDGKINLTWTFSNESFSILENVVTIEKCLRKYSEVIFLFSIFAQYVICRVTIVVNRLIKS
jgi:hypothetical protein